eukprot:scaffold85080_cov31-Tisochrysis_lutea.AAC.11
MPSGSAAPAAPPAWAMASVSFRRAATASPTPTRSTCSLAGLASILYPLRHGPWLSGLPSLSSLCGSRTAFLDASCAPLLPWPALPALFPLFCPCCHPPPPDSPTLYGVGVLTSRYHDLTI